MNRKITVKILSVFLALVTVFLTAAMSVYAFPNLFSRSLSPEEEAVRASIADEIVEVALAQKGFYESNVNKFTTWYYGFDTDAYWCSIFVSWCAAQVGAVGTAVPKRAACLSMKNWFDSRNEFHYADSDYVPQKGDIVFINTAVDGTDDIHHVEIVTQSGFITRRGVKNVKCIGGNTSDINYNGSEYVTEKVRPVKSSKAEIVGYAHPSYEKCDGFFAEAYAGSFNSAPALFRYIAAKILEMTYRIESFFAMAF